MVYFTYWVECDLCPTEQSVPYYYVGQDPPAVCAVPEGWRQFAPPVLLSDGRQLSHLCNKHLLNILAPPVKE